VAVTELSEVYGEQYYAGYYERSPKWFNFFNHIADCLVEQFEPKKHLDAGCAWGLLVEALRERGVQSFGIDFSAYALEQAHPDIQPYCRRASLT
jgi:2-polyprenyl-3-methyl-5-hydroxy-6-metoxy-1,4-benzoquinol methylase